MKNNLKLKITTLAAFVFAGLIVIILFQSCKQKVRKSDPSRFSSPTAKFAVDESFSPIVDEELYVFKALNPKARPTILYAPENAAVNLLLADSTRVLMISRDLTKEEYSALAAKNLMPKVTRFAIDAIALIVNKASTDTNITVSEIKNMLNGHTKTGKNIVFDNPNSGLVRYLKEFSGNKDLKEKNVFALKSNKEVIKYVSQHAGAIGITGFSWLNDPDKDYARAVDNVKIAGIRNDIGNDTSRTYFTPSQTTLALKQYPLTRNLYFINCTGNYGLGMEFAEFLEGDRGQRIILKSGLLPENIPPRQLNIVGR